ncbi:MAG: hypothetical protein ACJ8C4_15820 [Gemmataceae bacterium]
MLAGYVSGIFRTEAIMLQWLRQRPASQRRPARAAAAQTPAVQPAFESVAAPIAPPPSPLIQISEPVFESVPIIEIPQPVVPPPVAQLVRTLDEEIPPPFFADEDPAFLDFGDAVSSPVAATPPPLPQMPLPDENRIAEALDTLPPFPEPDAADRVTQLLLIQRRLDQIASEACEVLLHERAQRKRVPVLAIPR